MNTTAQRASTALDVLLLAGACVVIGAWLVGRPIGYAATTPVMSVFTAFSLLVMVGVRLLRTRIDTWPMPLSLAMLGLVVGGNLSSLLMLTSVPPALVRSLGGLVLTSIPTSIGLILFCAHDGLVALRNTPRSALLVDDILIHLALVPGGLTLLGHLLRNPGYLGIGEDPRIGISLLEAAFMGAYAVSAVLSNPDLFLWRFLAAGWTNRLVFAGLFANQFVAPVVVAYAVSTPGPTTGPGVELFVMLAGVLATLTFLLVQAWQVRRRSDDALAA